MKNITFLVSGNGGTLKFIYFAIEKLSLSLKINYVIGDRNCGAIEFAKKQNIHSEIIPYSRKNSERMDTKLSSLDSEIIITNVHKILALSTLKSNQAQFVNLHYSLLPSFSGLIGMKTVDEARKSNCQFIGATTHQVIEEVDRGTILNQASIAVNWNLDLIKIYDAVFKSGCIILLDSLITNYQNTPIIDGVSTTNINSMQTSFNPKLNVDIDVFDLKFWNTIS